MPLSAEGPNRSFRQNVTLAILLAWVAGAINAAGFFVLGTHTSHITGQAAAVGEAIASGRGVVAVEAGKLLIVFILGAATAAALLDITSGRKRGRYTLPLLLEALVLGSVAIWAAHRPEVPAAGMTQALCFAMGLQNALVTRISGAVIRTTHLTGVLTDFGMELVHIFRWTMNHVRLRGLPGVWQAVRGILVAAEFERAGLHLALVSSFLFGATVGPLLVLRYNEKALGVPCIVLLALIVLDWRRPARR